MRLFCLLALFLISCSTKEYELNLKDNLVFKNDSDSPFTGESIVSSQSNESLFIATNFYNNGILKKTTFDNPNMERVYFLLDNFQKKSDQLYYLGNSKMPFSGRIYLEKIRNTITFDKGLLDEVIGSQRFPKNLSVYKFDENKQLSLVAGSRGRIELAAIINPYVVNFNCLRDFDYSTSGNEGKTFKISVDQMLKKVQDKKSLSIEENNDIYLNSFSLNEILEKLGYGNILTTFSTYTREMGYEYNSAGFSTGGMRYYDQLSTRDVCTSNFSPNFSEIGALIDNKRFGTWLEYDFKKNDFVKIRYFDGEQTNDSPKISDLNLIQPIASDYNVNDAYAGKSYWIDIQNTDNPSTGTKIAYSINPNETLTPKIINSSLDGSVKISNENIIFFPSEDFYGRTASIAYQVVDSNGNKSNIAKINIFVNKASPQDKSVYLNKSLDGISEELNKSLEGMSKEINGASDKSSKKKKNRLFKKLGKILSD